MLDYFDYYLSSEINDTVIQFIIETGFRSRNMKKIRCNRKKQWRSNIVKNRQTDQCKFLFHPVVGFYTHFENSG